MVPTDRRGKALPPNTPRPAAPRSQTIPYGLVVETPDGRVLKPMGVLTLKDIDLMKAEEQGDLNPPIKQAADATPDEVWTMKDGTEINVSDMSEDHVRNALRMILRKRRRLALSLARRASALDALDLDDDLGLWSRWGDDNA